MAGISILECLRAKHAKPDRVTIIHGCSAGMIFLGHYLMLYNGATVSEAFRVPTALDNLCKRNLPRKAHVSKAVFA
jgi:hypothetical protein